jgi:hypothetical protein
MEGASGGRKARVLVPEWQQSMMTTFTRLQRVDSRSQSSGGLSSPDRRGRKFRRGDPLRPRRRRDVGAVARIMEHGRRGLAPASGWITDCIASLVAS